MFDGDVDVYNFGSSASKAESKPGSSRVNKSRQETNCNFELSAGRANNKLVINLN